MLSQPVMRAYFMILHSFQIINHLATIVPEWCQRFFYGVALCMLSRQGSISVSDQKWSSHRSPNIQMSIDK